MSKKSYHLPIQGMTCAACVARVERSLSKMDGIENVSVNLANEKAYFDLDEAKLSLTAVAQNIAAAGYQLILPQEGEPGAEEKNLIVEREARLLHDLQTSLCFAIPVFIISMLMEFHFFHSFWPLSRWDTHKILFLLTTPVVFLPGRRFFSLFWKNVRQKTADMNSLVAIGTGSAYGYSSLATLFPQLFSGSSLNLPHVYFDSTVVIISLVLLGRWLESRAKRKTTAAIQGLLTLQPQTACVRRNGIEQWIPLSALRVSDRVVVRPGERIPADGTMVNGQAHVDESMISGESLPVDKSSGDRVLAGTINRSGAFEFDVAVLGEQSVLGQIIKLVEQAQGSKAPIQQLADRIAAVFVPVVMMIALLTFFWWWFGGQVGIAKALMHFVAVLVIACPCALGLATPTAIIAGIGWAAARGLYVKDSESLELAQQVKVVLLDKTGTITQGRPEVQGVYAKEGVNEDELLTMASAVENKSEHPLAKAVVAAAQARGLVMPEAGQFSNQPGTGVQAVVSGRKIIIGNQKQMLASQISIDALSAQAQRCLDQGQTLLYLAGDGVAQGFISLADPIKESSAAAIQRLQGMNLRVVMLTGDHPQAAAAIAEKAGITDFVAEVMPQQKVEEVKKFQARGQRVAMVGDGINDAPALAQADVGIAIGAGTDVAIESASVILVKNDLNGVAQSILISRKTMRTIKQNLFWAFFYNLLGIPLAAAGVLNPMIAALAMSFSSVSVVSNSLRLAMTDKQG